MYDWNNFQYVLALNEAGTMKRAAVLLGTNPTTVSRHIKKLNDMSGYMIFVQGQGGEWKITDEGKTLLELASDFQERVDRLEDLRERRSRQETITITSIEFLLTYFLAPRINEAIDCYPDTLIKLRGSDKRLSVAYGEADLALRFARPVEGQLVASKISEMPFYLWSETGALPDAWVGLDEPLDWVPEMQLAHKVFSGPPLVRVTSFAALGEAAAALGIAAVGPERVMSEIPKLKKVESVEPVYREIWSVIHENRRHDKRLAAVREWAKLIV